jgi:membrane-associated phospholipid phosphatase
MLKYMRHFIQFSIFTLFICASTLQAQNHYNISQFTHETGDFLKQPGHWRGNDWLKLGLISAGTILIMQADQPIRKTVINGDRKYYRSVPIEAGRIWGEWYTPPIIVGGFAMHGWLAHNGSSKKISFEILQAVIYSETVTGVLKIAFGRARPYENKGAFSFHPFSLTNIGFQSLPGGHNTEGWAMSTVLSRNAHSTSLKIIAYAPAALTFISRIYQDQHWTSDDFLGAAIGFVIGSWVVDLHKKKQAALYVSSIYPITISIRF